MNAALVGIFSVGQHPEQQRRRFENGPHGSAAHNPVASAISGGTAVCFYAGRLDPTTADKRDARDALLPPVIGKPESRSGVST
jgi:hypothetical protein